MNHQDTAKEIRQLIRRWTGRREEARILELLTDCQGSALDDVLQQLNMRALVRNLHNRVNGPNNRDALLHLLTVDRIHDLSLHTRTQLVWALQRGFTSSSLEMSIRNVILASTGEELRDLRNELNHSGTFRDLPRLIYSDIDNDAIRTEIIEHIAANQSQTDEVKVLSDIDDTVFARLHDRRYPGKTRYPGVLAFFNALDRAPAGQGNTGDLTFVTARPGLLAGIVAAITRRALKKAGIQQHTILTGGLLALRSHHHMAERKLANIRRYHQLFPEYGLVFVGDNGQGDVQVGREMLRELGDAVRGVFIHDINQPGLNHRDMTSDDGIFYFDTYIAAADAAWQAGIISSEQAIEVGKAAITDIEALVAIPHAMKQSRLEEHQHDFDELSNSARGDDTKTP